MSINSREVKQAVDFYNRSQNGNGADEIDLSAIERLEEIVEDLVTTMREVSNLIDDAEQLWIKGQIQPVVIAAPTNSDYPENSSYPKGWWLQTIIPQILAMKTHLETENGGGVSPNEVFFQKPPRQEQGE